MSLRKYTMTAARLESNRRNARKSTAPRTERGKSQSRMNARRSGVRSRLRSDLMRALVDALPRRTAQTAQAVLNPAQLRHPLFAKLVFIKCQSELQLLAGIQGGSCTPDCFLYDRSH
jgi:hypothetical protein